MAKQATNPFSLDPQVTDGGTSTSAVRSGGRFAKINQQLMLDMYFRQRLPIAAIASHFSVTPAAVYGVIRRNGMEPNREPRQKHRGNRIKKGVKMWIRRLHNRGMNQGEIASKLGISKPTVGKYLREAGALRTPVARKQQEKVVVARWQPLLRPWYRRLLDWFRR